MSMMQNKKGCGAIKDIYFFFKSSNIITLFLYDILETLSAVVFSFVLY